MSQSKEEVKSAVTVSRYGRIAAVYEFGANLGSGGQIAESKKFHLEHLGSTSQKILYPGAGWGTEAALAAKAGHKVTVVELDSTMLQKAQGHFKDMGVFEQIECIHGSIMDFDRPSTFDVVVVNYLLDVFSPEVMPTVYAHLVKQCRSGGLVTFAGYAPLSGSILHKGLQWVNHAYANLFCVITVRNARHGIYNYGAYFEEHGLTLVADKEFPMFHTFGPRFLKAWVSRKA